MNSAGRIQRCLEEIYGPQLSPSVLDRLRTIMQMHQQEVSEPNVNGLSERDAFLITYPDQVQEADRPSLACLTEFAEERLQGIVSGIHLLPFYPSSSDEGFSVMDYRAVAPQYGGWDDVSQLGRKFRLMFDAVLNHVSSDSRWFHGFLANEPPYKDYFIPVYQVPDCSAVVRPRLSPFYSNFGTPRGEQSVWTTFSPDQVDLNYRNPEVMLAMLDLLLFYAGCGASFLRLDAVGFLWKESGTSCFNTPQTHSIVRLIRAVFDEVAPKVMLLTEINAAQPENTAYFGDGANEAHLVYNFALAPLILHTFLSGQAQTLSDWAARLTWPSDTVTSFNVLATHDGIGLNAAHGILSEPEILALVERIEAAGGRVSHRSGVDGARVPYELNVNYFDALECCGNSDDLQFSVARFVTAHAILLSLRGIPGMYFHSLFGSRGWPEGVAKTGSARSINRERLNRYGLEAALADRASLRWSIYGRLRQLLTIRCNTPAFAPGSGQQILQAGPGVFALARSVEGAQAAVLCLHNVTGQSQRVLSSSWRGVLDDSAVLHDLITQQRFDRQATEIVVMEPYQTAWLSTETRAV